MRRAGWMALLVLGATSLLGCQLPAAIPCEHDSECPDGGICDDQRFYCRPATAVQGIAPTAGGLEALHRGEEQLSSRTTFERALEPPVDAARAFLVFSATCDDVLPASCQVSGELLDSGAAVKFRRTNANDDAQVHLSWFVVQHRDIEVRRGSFTPELGTAPTVVHLTPPVDETRSFLLSSVHVEGNAFNQDDWFLGQLVDGGALSFRSGDTAAGARIYWQVVQLGAGATVARGLDTLEEEVEHTVDAGDVELAHSFPLLTTCVELDQTVSEELPSHALRAELLPTSQIKLTRGGAQYAISAAWELVSWSALRAQQRTASFVVGQPAQEVVLETPVDPAHSLVLIPAHQRQGSLTGSDDSHMGAAWFKTELFEDGSRVGLFRGWEQRNADVTFTVLEFQ